MIKPTKKVPLLSYWLIGNEYNINDSCNNNNNKNK